MASYLNVIATINTLNYFVCRVPLFCALFPADDSLNEIPITHNLVNITNKQFINKQ